MTVRVGRFQARFRPFVHPRPVPLHAARLRSNLRTRCGRQRATRAKSSTARSRYTTCTTSRPQPTLTARPGAHSRLLAGARRHARSKPAVRANEEPL
eukprot:3541007-Prymnesium_polylepis.1